MMIDLGTGNNNKINWAMNNKQELIDIMETIYRGARKGTTTTCFDTIRAMLFELYFDTNTCCRHLLRHY